jgi:hypothetical protein
MVYLFNSAFRPLYIRNVLNTLYLPKGCSNEYRYRCVPKKGDNSTINIDPQLKEQLLKLKYGTPICILFIDRFSPEQYIYHPLRLGKFEQIREENEYIYFNVILEKFIYPRDNMRFNELIRRELQPKGLPVLRNRDPFITSDGYYAIDSSNIFENKSDYFDDITAWPNIVEGIRSCRSFGPNIVREPNSTEIDGNQYEYIFARSQILDNSGKPIKPNIKSGKSVFLVNRGRKYTFSYSFRYPAQLINLANQAKVEINSGENIKMVGGKEINIDTYSNNPLINFATKQYVEDSDDSISLKYTTQKANTKIIGSESPICIQLVESRFFWVQLIIALILFSLFGVIISIDFSTITQLNFPNVVNAVWPKLVLSFAQALVVYWILKLVGQKVP